MKSENSVSIDIREIVTSIAGILKRTRDQLHAENLPESQLLLSGGIASNEIVPLCRTSERQPDP